MLFTFKRDDEGRERIYVGDVCVAEDISHDDGVTRYSAYGFVHGVGHDQIMNAIERADEVGFWERDWCGIPQRLNDVTVDVPIAETTVLSVTLDGEDQS